MLSIFRNLLSRNRERVFSFSRPLVLLQSDDWGRVGVRDREGFEVLRASGIRLGERPYDFYTLETAEDVGAMCSLLRRHRDVRGKSPCMTMNFCTANLDFTKMREEGFRRMHLLPLSKGLPGAWSRPGLLEAYHSGNREGLLKPALHGNTHCCVTALENALREDGDRAQLLRIFWQAETPYIFWRMPWVGYEFWNPEKPRAGFLSLDEQRALIDQACINFYNLFGNRPLTACAPGYRSNHDTCESWSESGIRVCESGTGGGIRPPHLDHFGILHLHRTIDFEPFARELEISKYLEIASTCFSRGLPLVISVHSINFHSTQKDFRSVTITGLDQLLTALETKFPQILYTSDEELYTLISDGALQGRSDKVQVFAGPLQTRAHGGTV